MPSIGRSTPFASTAFELELGAISDPVRVTRGWALLRVAEIHEPRIPALDQVRTEAESRLRTELVRKAALDRLTSGRDAGFDALAGAIDASVEESESFGGDGPGGTLGSNAEIARAALAADEGDVVGPIATESGAVIFEVLERVKVDPEEYAQQKTAARAALVQQRGGQLVAALIAQRRKELVVSFDSQLLAAFDLDLAGPASRRPRSSAFSPPGRAAMAWKPPRCMKLRHLQVGEGVYTRPLAGSMPTPQDERVTLCVPWYFPVFHSKNP